MKPKFLVIIKLEDNLIEMYVTRAVSWALRYIFRKKSNRVSLQIMDMKTGEPVNIEIKKIESYTFIRI